ncbi:patatin-like phospholipase family protein [Enterovibrio calviensis]|uniref:patatin-like phospholipase family protein n=1 Tax=Enterovibrio calviensis TaxID=91359 RepID=UPI0004877E5E|nr:patatin-like phospholipase family protein [Enterovibrio calviensis]
MSVKILSIDGGGIRGIIAGQILVALEEKLRIKSGDNTKKIGDFFDLVAGTSTGAILGCAYICPNETGGTKYNASEAVDIYLNEGDEIFDIDVLQKIKSFGGLRDEKYSADALETALFDYFGDTKLSALTKPCCFVSYDIRSRNPVIFNSKNRSGDTITSNDFYVRDILRGTSAAPTYFEPARIYSLAPNRRKHILIDGGLVANDPALCAYNEALKCTNAKGIKDMVIVSIGTGKELKSYTYNQSKDWGPLGWAKPALDITLEAGPQMTAYHMEMIASTVKNSKYFRISPELHNAKPDLDDASSENLRALSEAGKINAKQFNSELDEIADALLA